MLRVLRSTAAVAGILTLFVAVGCSSSGSQGQSANSGMTDDLLEVAGMLRDFTAENQKGPAKLADVAKNQPLYPRGYQAVKAGTVVVVWGARMPLPGQGGGTGVIAYEKKAETDGGAVLLENGDIKNMTAAEFASAPKVK
jgi:hypothetical protein